MLRRCFTLIGIVGNTTPNLLVAPHEAELGQTLTKGQPTMRGNGKIAEFLRERAKRYRELAARDDDPDRAAVLRELAEVLEREADAMDNPQE